MRSGLECGHGPKIVQFEMSDVELTALQGQGTLGVSGMLSTSTQGTGCTLAVAYLIVAVGCMSESESFYESSLDAMTSNAADAHNEPTILAAAAPPEIDIFPPAPDPELQHPLVEVVYGAPPVDVMTGVTASDHLGNDLTDQIQFTVLQGREVIPTTRPGNYAVLYQLDGAVNRVRGYRVHVNLDVGQHEITLRVGDPVPDLFEDVLLLDHDGNEVVDDFVATAEISGGVSVIPTDVLGTYIVTYGAVDDMNNPQEVSHDNTRTYHVIDDVPPQIQLDDPNVEVAVGDPLIPVMQGVRATDNVDGDITSQIVVGGDSPVPNQAGVYHVTYDVTDSSSNVALTKTRTYTVVAPTCASQPCHVNATCQDGPRRCRCNAGYAGDGETCTEVDGCATNPCGANAVCVDDAPPSVRRHCSCQPGYIGDGETCIEVDGCVTNPCGANAVCVDDAPPSVGRQCSCEPGYVGDGETCIEVDGCVTNPCGANAVCVDGAPPSVGRQCSCEPGYVGDGETCIEVDGCATNPCGANAVCVDDAPPSVGRQCSCEPGYVGDGETCIEVDGCATNPCGANAVCVDDAPPSVGRQCSCEPGYVGDGETCIEVDGCATNPCGANAVCVDDAPPSTGRACRCHEPYRHDGDDCVLEERMVRVRQELSPGWNLFSVALHVRPSPSVFHVLHAGGGAATKMIRSDSVWEWQGDAYSIATVLEPGRGYWVYVDGSSAVTIEYEGVLALVPSRGLTRGWNLVGVMDVVALSVPHRSAVTDILGWDARLQQFASPSPPAAVLMPGQGYWFYAASAVDSISLGRHKDRQTRSAVQFAREPTMHVRSDQRALSSAAPLDATMPPSPPWPASMVVRP